MNESVNTVPSSNQLKRSRLITFYPGENGKKVTIVGNSITYHGCKPEIGWFGEWGMAASAPEKDYVHLLKARLEERFGAVDLCVAQCSIWERARHGEKAAILAENFASVQSHAAELLIVRIGENIRFSETNEKDLRTDIAEFISFLTEKAPAAQVICTGLFWDHAEKEAAFREVADANGYAFVNLADLGKDDAMRATGLFEHTGVAAHPGDRGMQAICDRIFSAI